MVTVGMIKKVVTVLPIKVGGGSLAPALYLFRLEHRNVGEKPSARSCMHRLAIFFCDSLPLLAAHVHSDTDEAQRADEAHW